MELLAILALPSALGLLIMGAIITRNVYIGGKEWEPMPEIVDGLTEEEELQAFST